MVVFYFLVSFFACMAGAICGIGGGVIIKPVLDLLGLASVSTISFLSACTVFSMCLYAVGRAFLARDSKVNMRLGTPLAVGAAIGGMLGSLLFDFVRGLGKTPDRVGAVQAAFLALFTLGSIVYTIQRNKIPTRKVGSIAACIAVGLALGALSSFLGIGGGPFNLVVLYYFFSMDTKTAAANSLYIILFSQTANILATVLSGNVPSFSWLALILMVAGGILGGVMGRTANKRLTGTAVERLFVSMMVLIFGICCYNFVRFL